MREQIDPRVDIAFKKIFGVEENKDLLMSLINSIVAIEDQVTEVTLLNPYNLQSFKSDKLSVLDIKATGHNGKRFNIEIQITDEADYDKRALYYWAKLYSEQLMIGENYATLSKAIGIHILNFTSIPQVIPYHNVFHIREKETGIPYFNDLELHTIELNKFTGHTQKEKNSVLLRVKDKLDMWSAFLTRHDLLNQEHLPDTINVPELKKALHVLDTMNFKPEEREAYESHLKWLRIETNTLYKRYEDGKIEGRKEGIIEMAKKMLSKQKPIEEIIELTDLTREQIEQIKSSL